MNTCKQLERKRRRRIEIMTIPGWRIYLVGALVLFGLRAEGRVVINEIFYHAPDDIKQLEYIELYNTGDDAVDLSGWSFTKGIKFKFDAVTEIPAIGFLVLFRNKKRFGEFYNAPVAAEFKSKLSNKGERLELSDARGRIVDTVKYQDSAPWPLGADGLSGSLERICPEAGGDNPANWACSPLSAGRLKPAGTPGKTNANYSAHLPPIIANVKLTPENPAPDEAVTVEAIVRDAGGIGEVKVVYRIAGAGFEKPEASLPMQKAAGDRYTAVIPGQAANQLIRSRIEAVGVKGNRRVFPAPTEPRPALSAYVYKPVKPARIPFGWMITTDKSGNGAFIYFDPATNKLQVFDFVEIDGRGGGYKVHFAKGQMLRQMSTINVIFDNDRAALVEPLAYEVYRRAGMAAEQSYQMRLWFNTQRMGYFIVVEQPNRAFLRRNQMDEDGNIYKLLWYERGVVRQHEKKTNTREGHEDLVKLIDALRSTRGDAQWEVINTHFDVEQVATYFAVNMVLSHWDGFFNNYFTYHDTQRTDKWTMFPWDQDKTWGIYDGMGDRGVFYDMPITFGMDGDDGPRRGGGMWWRPPGYFSGPLLANRQFRKIFLARTKEILETVYTEQVFGPIIDALGDRLRDEVRIRAEINEQNGDQALQRFEMHLKIPRAREEAPRISARAGRNQEHAEPQPHNGLEMKHLFVSTAIFTSGILSALAAEVSGPITADTTWSAAKSPYIISGPFTINSGTTLTIEPGTTVHLGAKVDLVVTNGGRLLAEGTAEKPILFSRPPNVKKRWGGIVIMGGPKSPETRIKRSLIHGSSRDHCLTRVGLPLSMRVLNAIIPQICKEFMDRSNGSAAVAAQERAHDHLASRREVVHLDAAIAGALQLQLRSAAAKP